MKHGNQEVKDPSKLRRIVDRVDRTTKWDLVQMIRDLHPGTTRRTAEQAYDLVTSAMNAWVLTWSKSLPYGVHAKLLMRDCFCVNMCWFKGKQGAYAAYPKLWINVADRASGPGARHQLKDLKHNRIRYERSIGLIPERKEHGKVYTTEGE